MKRMLPFVLDVVREYGTNDPNIIIKELNIPVYESWACTLLRVNGFYTKANKKQAIFTEPSLNKMQKDVVLAHELGHIKLKHHHARLAFDLLSDEQKEEREYQANKFAFLLIAHTCLRNDIQMMDGIRDEKQLTYKGVLELLEVFRETGCYINPQRE